ncbi:ATP-binding cassette domain-containing protein [Sulfitobacter sp. BDSS02]|nr:ATP-binding cassette domain-containing protein [Sulfitobacter sp. BDSS02]
MGPDTVERFSLPVERARLASLKNALDAVGLTEMADRPVQELSGGQRQRTWIALALAQNAPLLLLDEPTTYLDLVHEIDVLSLLRKRNVDDGLTVISVPHDLNVAARFSDTLILLGQCGLVAARTPEQVITPENLEMSFGLNRE